MTSEQKETTEQTAKKSWLRFFIEITIVSFLVGGCMAATGLLFCSMINYNDSGEHLSVPTGYPDDATDFSFYETFVSKQCEFNVPEKSFLKYSREKEWDIVDIEETVAFFPKVERTELLSHLPKQFELKKPLTIKRYNWEKNEHQDCGYKECKIDTTLLTDNACRHLVTKGYWYMTINGAGRGITVMYDKENERCYIEYRLR